MPVTLVVPARRCPSPVGDPYAGPAGIPGRAAQQAVLAAPNVGSGRTEQTTTPHVAAADPDALGVNGAPENFGKDLTRRPFRQRTGGRLPVRRGASVSHLTCQGSVDPTA
jgi:hypothetical protein